jgi:hypothetical protein
MEHERSLRELMESYDHWNNDTQVQSVLAALLPPAHELARTAGNFKYLADSLFLQDCYHFLMQEVIGQQRGSIGLEPEWACVVTGPLLGQVRVLDRLVTVKTAYQSAGGIRLSTDGLQEALVGLQQAGHALHAIFHSHRIHGVDGSRPSRIDLDTQENILEAAYPAIQAIFTEDGYIRFFSFKRTFNIEVYGKGVEHVEGTLFKLQHTGRPAAALFRGPVSYS